MNDSEHYLLKAELWFFVLTAKGVYGCFAVTQDLKIRGV